MVSGRMKWAARDAKRIGKELGIFLAIAASFGLAGTFAGKFMGYASKQTTLNKIIPDNTAKGSSISNALYAQAFQQAQTKVPLPEEIHRFEGLATNLLNDLKQRGIVDSSDPVFNSIRNAKLEQLEKYIEQDQQLRNTLAQKAETLSEEQVLAIHRAVKEYTTIKKPVEQYRNRLNAEAKSTHKALIRTYAEQKSNEAHAWALKAKSKGTKIGLGAGAGIALFRGIRKRQHRR